MESNHKIKGLCMQGRLVHKGDIKKGTSANGEWKAINFEVSEYKSDDNQYPQTLSFSAMNQQAEMIDTIPEMSDITVTFDLRGKEYKDRWFVELRAKYITVDHAYTPGEIHHDDDSDDEAKSDMPF